MSALALERRRLLIGCTLFLVVAIVGHVSVKMATFEHVILSALTDGGLAESSALVRWNLPGTAADLPWLHALPPAATARCKQRLMPVGACCQIEFQDGRWNEVHVFLVGLGRYELRKFTKPRYGLCRNPDFDREAEPESREGQEFVECSGPQWYPR